MTQKRQDLELIQRITMFIQLTNGTKSNYVHIIQQYMIIHHTQFHFCITLVSKQQNSEQTTTFQ